MTVMISIKPGRRAPRSSWPLMRPGGCSI
jgi:hypothetical protein